MFELFPDTFTYGYNIKVNVKFKVKYKKIVKNANWTFLFGFVTKFT